MVLSQGRSSPSQPFLSINACQILWYAAMRGIVKAWATLQTAWVTVTTALTIAWVNFNAMFQKTWHLSAGIVGKGVQKLLDMPGDQGVLGS